MQQPTLTCVPAKVSDQRTFSFERIGAVGPVTLEFTEIRVSQLMGSQTPGLNNKTKTRAKHSEQ